MSKTSCPRALDRASERNPSEEQSGIISVRKKIYLVTLDRPQDCIRDFEVDQQKRLVDMGTDIVSDWSFESATRLSTWGRPGKSIIIFGEEVNLEDEEANRYFTFDFGKAVEKLVQVQLEDRDVA